jgi:protocatechuate 3,4-dioxygenase beta subunit
MENDDETIGHIISRRELLVLLGVAGTTALTGCGSRAGAGDGAASSALDSVSCVARPQQTEGPFFVDERLLRGDIRADPTDGSVRPGLPLALAFQVSRLNGSSCSPVPNAVVDVWQCDAHGAYAGVSDSATARSKFLRGYQLTDTAGRAAFTTIYPGWYQGRAVHIHFKVRSSLTGTGYEFTSQLYFPDTLTDTVHAQQPYAARGMRRTRNENDGIFRNGGSELMLAPTQNADGYTASFHIALQV